MTEFGDSLGPEPKPVPLLETIERLQASLRDAELLGPARTSILFDLVPDSEGVMPDGAESIEGVLFSVETSEDPGMHRRSLVISIQR